MIAPMRWRSSALKQNPCDETCEWVSTNRVRGGERVYECTGCESEWVRSADFIPKDIDGTINPDIQDELDAG